MHKQFAGQWKLAKLDSEESAPANMPGLKRTRSKMSKSISTVSDSERCRRICINLLENFVTKQEEYDQFQQNEEKDDYEDE